MVRWVLDRAVVEDGRRIGWRARAQVAPRMEITAEVIDSLLRAGVALAVDDIVRMLGELVDETTAVGASYFGVRLSGLCSASRRMRSSPQRLIRALLDGRVDFAGTLLWPKKRLHRDEPLLTPSVPHTAHAVAVLRAAPGDLVGDAVAAAEQWVTGADDLNGVTEIIRRDLDVELFLGQPGCPCTASRPRGLSAPSPAPPRPTGAGSRRARPRLGALRPRSSPPGLGKRLTAPVWMLADAVAALHDAALALHTAPTLGPA